MSGASLRRCGAGSAVGAGGHVTHALDPGKQLVDVVSRHFRRGYSADAGSARDGTTTMGRHRAIATRQRRSERRKRQPHTAKAARVGTEIAADAAEAAEATEADVGTA